MTRILLAAGVAALAITTPAAAGPHGGGHGNGGRQAAAQSHGGGGGHGQKAQKARGGGQQARQAKAEKARGGGQHARQAKAQASRGGGQHARQAQARERGHARQVREAQARQNRGAEKRSMQAQRARANDRAKNIRTAERVRANRQNEIRRELVRRNQLLGRNNTPVLAVRERAAELRGRQFRQLAEARNRELARVQRANIVRARDWEDLARGGIWMDGCPPGLAKKPVACIPPGQANKLLGQRLRSVGDRIAFRELPNRLQYVYADTPDYYYRYGNGYVYRVNRSNDLISSLLPLFGLGYTAGQVFPSAYPYYGMPAAYQPFYPSSPYANYRYADGYMYQVNPYTGMIQDVDPLLGYGYGYGQMMPLTYSAYNVPYQYRPYYYDTSDSYYRYAPGAIYQVDPSTSLITAVAALLSPNSLAIGQPMPIGYSAYNVPYAYRSTYYDTPNDWYRYSNGNIYRVDPATQLVTALVVSALT
jgi:hypothetical protein